MESQKIVKNSLQLTCKNQPATLERLLRVVRFRGFSVVDFNAQLTTDGSELSVSLTVSSSRPLHLLESQLRKNYDVVSLKTVHTSELADVGVLV